MHLGPQSSARDCRTAAQHPDSRSQIRVRVLVHPAIDLCRTLECMHRQCSATHDQQMRADGARRRSLPWLTWSKVSPGCRQTVGHSGASWPRRRFQAGNPSVVDGAACRCECSQGCTTLLESSTSRLIIQQLRRLRASAHSKTICPAAYQASPILAASRPAAMTVAIKATFVVLLALLAAGSTRAHEISAGALLQASLCASLQCCFMVSCWWDERARRTAHFGDDAFAVPVWTPAGVH